jgi:MerR family redox-sensitive transcriptional activator SoxR
MLAGMWIGELARVSGVPASTIRYWEKVGILPRPVRQGGKRRYGEEAAARLALLRLALGCGFTLLEMRRLLHGFEPGTPPPVRWQEMARRKKTELAAQVRRLRAMDRVLDQLLACRCRDLRDCARLVPPASGVSP